MKRRLSTLVELCGYAAVTAAAWLLDMRLGLLIGGAALVVIAYGMERS